MTIQTSIPQRAAPSGGQEDVLASFGAAQGASREPQRERVENVTPTTPAGGGGGILVAAVLIFAAVFVAGFMRTRVERGVRRLSRRLGDRAANIDVPLALPLAVADTIRQVLAERRGTASSSGEQPVAT